MYKYTCCDGADGVTQMIDVEVVDNGGTGSNDPSPHRQYNDGMLIKLLPVILTCVPPVTLPSFGTILVTIGT